MKKLLDYFGDWTFGSLIMATLFTVLVQLGCIYIHIALFPLSVLIMRFGAWVIYPEKNERFNPFTRPIILATIINSVVAMSIHSAGWKEVFVAGIVPSIAGYLIIVVITNPSNFASTGLFDRKDMK